MILSIQQKFEQMDSFSTRGEPFFFMVDFLLENLEIYTVEDLQKSDILIEFQGFKNFKPKEFQANIEWKTFPEVKEIYKKGFDIVKKNLRLGNSYLINYTQRSLVETNRSLEEIFYLSKAQYKVCVPSRFVFFSPETFIKITDGKISTYPMKGTIDASIPEAEEQLRNDEKEKAEHYTVVDLLRNDLSMVANNVRVEDFQRIDFIRTRQKNLFAMSSEISGELKPRFQNKVGSIINTLLPAGSILGAPKPKTLEVTLQAEKNPRGWYTGVCGWFDGKNLDSCVMIRMIQKDGDKFYFHSGGGITHKSCLDDEYEEMKNKIYVPIY